MPHTSDAEITRILKTVKRIALVGASPNPARPSYEVMEFLIGRGYEVVPVNPGLAGQTLHGQTVYGRLADIPGRIDMIDVFRNSEAAGEVVDEALALAIKPGVVWMQLGVVNEEAANRARTGGIEVVMNHCPAIEIPRLGL